MSQTASTTQPPQGPGPEATLRGLLATRRWLALVVAAVCVVMIAMLALAVFGSKSGAVTDSTTCSQWGSADQGRQTTYARLYIHEHGRVSARWGGPVPGVINAINVGCAQAFGEDVDNTVTVVQAISRNF